MSLRNNKAGYWGCMNEEVRNAISDVVDYLGTDGNGNFVTVGDIAAGSAQFIGLVDAADDTAAASAGVAIDELYHNNGAVRIRLT